MISFINRFIFTSWVKNTYFFVKFFLNKLKIFNFSKNREIYNLEHELRKLCQLTSIFMNKFWNKFIFYKKWLFLLWYWEDLVGGINSDDIDDNRPTINEQFQIWISVKIVDSVIKNRRQNTDKCQKKIFFKKNNWEIFINSLFFFSSWFILRRSFTSFKFGFTIFLACLEKK